MPAKSEAQRRLLNARFGHAWVKRHHFDNKGKLPSRVKKKGKKVVKHTKRKTRRGKTKTKAIKKPKSKKKCPECGKPMGKCTYKSY